ncbi:MAG: transposase [Thermodesulfovibrionales bacterium]|nr:transposase [Thermodesulfovibrionales bacterium]
MIYLCLGIDLDGRKSLLGYYIYWGSESRGEWLEILNYLIKRGLKRVMLVVSDNFSGLSQAIEALFPEADHQLCLVHLKRNLKKNMSKEDVKVFMEKLEVIRRMNDFEKAILRFEDLCKRYERKYPAYVKVLLTKKERNFQYMKYPEGVRRHIYTTNVVENINSRLELLRMNTAGYFQSMRTAEVEIYVTLSRIERTKWKAPMPLVKSALYEIKQMFNVRFFKQTQFS